MKIVGIIAEYNPFHNGHEYHIERAKEICREKNVPVCDCYAIWKNLAACGVDTTELLCNRINHPSREMHKVFAYELIRTIFS